MTQDREDMERQIRDAARDYNEPPEPPRDEMWAAVREALPVADPSIDARSNAGGHEPLDMNGRRSARRDRDRLSRWTPWALGLAAAATLAVGFGLGRITDVDPGEGGSDGAVAGAAAAPAPEGPGTSLPVRMATAEHLGEAEAMLTLFRSSDRDEDRMATARWARDLLSTTRLMMDSRAGEDPQLADLLADLELVLVQIVGAGGQDQELIEAGLRDHQLMTKLRAAAEGPVTVSM